MKNSNLTIRSVKLSDLPEMQTLFVDTISAICKHDYSPEQIKVWTAAIENKQRWIDKITTDFFRVAQIGEQIVGYASLEKNDHVDFFYVHKDYQRQGIAETLYSELEAEAKKNKVHVLNANVSITAKSFFDKKGFMVIRRQVNIIHGVEIVNFKMAKQLIVQLEHNSLK